MSSTSSSPSVPPFTFKTIDDVKSKQYDFIVIGGGVYGSSFVHRIFELSAKSAIRPSVLALEKGSYLIPDHFQNLPVAYRKLEETAGIEPWTNTGKLSVMPQIPFLGGRGLFWNAWVPQPSESELAGWDPSLYENLRPYWYDVYNYLGRKHNLQTVGNESTHLTDEMRQRIFAALGSMESAALHSNPADLDSAMACGETKEAFTKFSPVSVLINAMSEFSNNLDVVLDTEVHSLQINNSKVVSIQLSDQTKLACDKSTVLFACNTLEASFIMKRSDKNNKLVGKNLCGHVRSLMTARVPVSSIPSVSTSDKLSVSGFYVESKARLDRANPTDDRLMHTHVTVVHNPHPKKDRQLLFKILPEPLLLDHCDDSHIVFLLQSMGEFLGSQNADSLNYTALDEKGKPIVHIAVSENDKKMWDKMDQITMQIKDALTHGIRDSDVEYLQKDNNWSTSIPDIRYFDKGVHESGTFWMGKDPSTSVTNCNGRLHNVSNLYAVGSMTFPRPGSFNPTMMGVAQCFHLAAHLLKKHPHRAN